MITNFKQRAPQRGRHFSRYQPRRSFSRAPQHSNRGRQSADIDVSRFINTGEVESAPSEAFAPVHRFADFKIDSRIKENIGKKGYITPTPIQDKAIPLVLEGRDIVGIANTG